MILSGLAAAGSRAALDTRAEQAIVCRDKARLLLAEALVLAHAEVPGADPSTRADELEQAIFVQNGAVNQRYKAKLRSLSFNLKDAKNPDLRRRVLAGDIAGDLGLSSSKLQLVCR